MNESNTVCHECGKDVNPENAFCPSCGVPLKRNETTVTNIQQPTLVVTDVKPKEKNKIHPAITLFIGIILGIVVLLAGTFIVNKVIKKPNIQETEKSEVVYTSETDTSDNEEDETDEISDTDEKESSGLKDIDNQTIENNASFKILETYDYIPSKYSSYTGGKVYKIAAKQNGWAKITFNYKDSDGITLKSDDKTILLKKGEITYFKAIYDPGELEFDSIETKVKTGPDTGFTWINDANNPSIGYSILKKEVRDNKYIDVSFEYTDSVGRESSCVLVCFKGQKAWLSEIKMNIYLDGVEETGDKARYSFNAIENYDDYDVVLIPYYSD